MRLRAGSVAYRMHTLLSDGKARTTDEIASELGLSLLEKRNAQVVLAKWFKSGTLERSYIERKSSYALKDVA